MKNLLIALLVLAAGVTVYATVQQSKPADCGSCPAEAKAVQVKQTKEAGCCAEKAVQVKQTKEAGCCAEKGTQVKQTKEASCCAEKGTQVKMAQDCGDCPADKMAECAAKHTKVVKGAKAVKTEQCGADYAKYKVYVDGKYYFYGCEESAGAARTKWTAKAFHVGTVQKVVGKVRIPANQAS